MDEVQAMGIDFQHVAMGLALSGCTKCGPVCCLQSPKSCKSDHF
jgi:hypothetical protein